MLFLGFIRYYLQIDIGDSEIIVVGLIIRFIIDLKNNYFGLYDQV